MTKEEAKATHVRCPSCGMVFGLTRWPNIPAAGKSCLNCYNGILEPVTVSTVRSPGEMRQSES